MGDGFAIFCTNKNVLLYIACVVIEFMLCAVCLMRKVTDKINVFTDILKLLYTNLESIFIIACMYSAYQLSQRFRKHTPD